MAVNVATVADLRAKVEEREAPLWAMRILGSIDDPTLVSGLPVKMHLTTGRREVIVSADGVVDLGEAEAEVICGA